MKIKLTKLNHICFIYIKLKFFELCVFKHFLCPLLIRLTHLCAIKTNSKNHIYVLFEYIITHIRVNCNTFLCFFSKIKTKNIVIFFKKGEDIEQEAKILQQN